MEDRRIRAAGEKSLRDGDGAGEGGSERLEDRGERQVMEVVEHGGGLHVECAIPLMASRVLWREISMVLRLAIGKERSTISGGRHQISSPHD